MVEAIVGSEDQTGGDLTAEAESSYLISVRDAII